MVGLNNKKVVDMLTNLSPVAWRHIQLAGHYRFDTDKTLIDLEGLLSTIDPTSEDLDELQAA